MSLVLSDIAVYRRYLFTFSVDMARVHEGSERTTSMMESATTVAAESLRNGSSINESAQNVLVVLTDTTVDQRLIREAGTYAASIDGRLVLLSVMPSDEFAEYQQAYAQIRDLPQYSLPKAREKHRQNAARSGQEALNSLDIEYTAVGAVGREADQVLATVREYDCGHVFLVDQPRSLLRRLVGNDVIRAIARGFDGPVTTLQYPQGL